MCGIIGYSGNEPAFSLLYEGLKRLEYRGYDSAGVCIAGKVVKNKGAVSELLKSRVFLSNCGSCGIGHTRWATHGEPSFLNAHPQSSGSIHIVHNGIIENSAELKAELEAKGYLFVSETDTECAAHLIASLYFGDLLTALKLAVKRLKGSFAIAAVGPKEGEIVAVKKDSPLVAGIGKDKSVHIASDIAAISDKCEKLYVFAENELMRANLATLEFFDADGNPVTKREENVDKSYESVSMGKYSTFMEKEIFDGAEAAALTAASLTDAEFKKLDLNGISHICFCACGTAYHAGLLGKALVEKHTPLTASAEIASELTRDKIKNLKGALFIFISQSGETADTIAAHAVAKEAGFRTVSVTNVSRSGLEALSDIAFRTYAGREYAVASTKAFLAQLAFIMRFTQHLSFRCGTGADVLKAADIKKLKSALKKAADVSVGAVCDAVKGEKQVYFLGRGQDYLIATEASLKLKEITYIHCEAYPAGELKHGTLALIERGTKVLAFLTERALIPKMMSNLSEVKARGAHVTLFTQFTGLDFPAPPDIIVKLPALPERLMPLVSIVPAQRLAFLVSTAKGIDCDKPRNLAKSVTVQ